MVTFSSGEKKLIKHAKEAVVRYNKMRKSRGGIDTLYAFIMSDSGKIYDGACFEASVSSGVICGERHAIANMILNESYKSKVKHVVVADPVPQVQRSSTTPCGVCRHVIWETGPDATVICMQYIKHKDTWTFHKIEKHKIKNLYPHPYTSVKW